MLTLRTTPPGWHPMHLHGHSFRVLKRNGSLCPYRQWADTVLVSPQETVDVAFVADNPGDWMLHCHVMDHQIAGLMTSGARGLNSQTTESNRGKPHAKTHISPRQRAALLLPLPAVAEANYRATFTKTRNAAAANATRSFSTGTASRST